MKITYRTRGTPSIGDYVRSTRKPRRAYFIVGVKRVHVLPGEWSRYRLTVEPLKADAVPAGAVILPIFWDSRRRRAR